MIVCAFSSLFLLLIYTYYYELETFSVYDFLHVKDSNDFLEKTTSLQGTVRNIEHRNEHLFFDLCTGSTCILCVVFNIKDFQKQTIFNNTHLKVVGKYTIYNNTPQIIVDRVYRVNL